MSIREVLDANYEPVLVNMLDIAGITMTPDKFGVTLANGEYVALALEEKLFFGRKVAD